MSGILVKDMNREYRRECLREEYDFWTHNCQHVARDVYNRLTGLEEISLRNDYVNWIVRDLPKFMREDFRMEDELYSEVKEFIETEVRPLLLEDNMTVKEIDEMTQRMLNPTVIKAIFDRLRSEDWTKDTQLTPDQIKEIQDLFGNSLTGKLEDLEI